MSQALYRKYRSKKLSEVVGQDHITRILQNALKQGKIAHAYLLTGPRGVGKTSVARILAHEINHIPYTDESTNLDIIEIDAASNNSVEDIRDLREKVRLAPIAAPKKIYIIDEVHMLSKSAFNALLKTLEEPPEHVIFILATTDVDKLPATIISRTQHFAFHPIAPADIVKQLRFIADKEKITISDTALAVIAASGGGSFRDSISMLDQLSGMATGKDGITPKLIEQAFGLAPQTVVTKLLEAYTAKNLGEVVKLLDEAHQTGVQPTQLASQLINYIRRHIVEQPQWLPLLNDLIEVARSAQPDIKLLVSLAPKPTKKSAALAVSRPALSAPLSQLEQQATKLKPHAVVKKITTIAKTDETKESSKKQGASTKKATPSASVANFNWQALLDYTKEHFLAIYSVLNRCQYRINDTTLTLYAGNGFYKKKLEDPKHAPNLGESLQAVGAEAFDIEILAQSAPLKDSQAAAVAAIMGGGEEVQI